MKKLLKIFSIALLGLWLTSCAHQGARTAKSPHDDSPHKTETEKLHQRIADLADSHRL